MATAAIATVQQGEGLDVRLSGDWTLARLPQPIAEIEAQLRDFQRVGPPGILKESNGWTALAHFCSGVPGGGNGRPG